MPRIAGSDLCSGRRTDICGNSGLLLVWHGEFMTKNIVGDKLDGFFRRNLKRN